MGNRRSTIQSAIRKGVESICRLLEENILAHPSYGETAVFGPVPSRRLGRSLGVNNIRRKTCSYDCTYCQSGRTTERTVCRDSHVNPYELFCIASNKVRLLSSRSIGIDCVSFVPNGEPTLDLCLSKSIVLIRELGFKTAVLTNSSLLWNDTVKENLLFADYVSAKIDTVDEGTWRRLNRPHRRLRFQTILNGLEDFSGSYQGVLTTETMLVKNANDSIGEVKAIGEFLRGVKRRTSYFAVPVRPPADLRAGAPSRSTLSDIADFVKANIPDSEMLCRPEENNFQGAGDMEQELLGILSVHPMNEEAVESFIRSKGGSPDTLNDLTCRNAVSSSSFRGTTFYRRNERINSAAVS